MHGGCRGVEGCGDDAGRENNERQQPLDASESACPDGRDAEDGKPTEHEDDARDDRSVDRRRGIGDEQDRDRESQEIPDGESTRAGRAELRGSGQALTEFDTTTWTPTVAVAAIVPVRDPDAVSVASSSIAPASCIATDGETQRLGR